MPIYEYEPEDSGKGCEYCSNGFEIMQGINDEKLTVCPKCSAPVRRMVSVPSVGASQSNLDDRAKKAGFTKLKRLGKGEYEKQY